MTSPILPISSQLHCSCCCEPGANEVTTVLCDVDLAEFYQWVTQRRRAWQVTVVDDERPHRLEVRP